MNPGVRAALVGEVPRAGGSGHMQGTCDTRVFVTHIAGVASARGRKAILQGESKPQIFWGACGLSD